VSSKPLWQWHQQSPNSEPAPDGKDQADRRRKQTKEKDSDMQSVLRSILGELLKKECKKCQWRPKEEQPAILSASLKVVSFSATEAQDTSSLNRSGSRSLQPSLTTANPCPLSCVVDEDYDKGVADALIVLSQSHSVPVHSPMLSTSSSVPIALPPIAMLSCIDCSFPHRRLNGNLSMLATLRGKLSNMMNPVLGFPTARPIASPPCLHEKRLHDPIFF
jgi:hypothetical protein